MSSSPKNRPWKRGPPPPPPGSSAALPSRISRVSDETGVNEPLGDVSVSGRPIWPDSPTSSRPEPVGVAQVHDGRACGAGRGAGPARGRRGPRVGVARRQGLSLVGRAIRLDLDVPADDLALGVVVDVTAR